jgi:hypothetical protein
MEHKNYKIIKLKSGETLICKLHKVLDKTLILERPMIFKSINLPVEFSGIAGEALVMKNWLEFSSDKTVEIPIDHIVALIKPDIMISQCYDIEKEKEDNPELKQQYMQDLMEKTKHKKINNQIPDKLNINFNIPDEMIPDVLDALGVDIPHPDDLIEDEEEDLFPEVKPPKKKKKKKKLDNKNGNKHDKDPNWGNDWSDWSPDPNDYLR